MMVTIVFSDSEVSLDQCRSAKDLQEKNKRRNAEDLQKKNKRRSAAKQR